MEDAKFISCLCKLDLPKHRCKITHANLIWLARNVGARNANNSLYPIVHQELSERLAGKTKKKVFAC